MYFEYGPQNKMFCMSTKWDLCFLCIVLIIFRNHPSLACAELYTAVKFCLCKDVIMLHSMTPNNNTDMHHGAS